MFINAALEELFFRGFVFFVLRKSMPLVFAYSYSVVLFAVYHVTMLDGWFTPSIFVLCMAGLIAAGVLFNVIAEKCETALGSYFVHAGANLAINLIGAYFFYQM